MSSVLKFEDHPTVRPLSSLKSTMIGNVERLEKDARTAIARTVAQMESGRRGELRVEVSRYGFRPQLLNPEP